MLFAVSCELSHDLTGENHSAFTQSVLDVCVNSELGRTVLRIESIVAEVDKPSDL